MEEKIVFADKGYRIQVIVMLVVMLAFLIWFGQYVIPNYKSDIQKLIEENRTEELRTTLNEIKYYIMGLMFLLVPFGSSLVYKGLRTIKTQTYPFPGMKVLRNTYILEGKDAQLRGYILIFLAVVLILSGLILTILSSMLVDSLVAAIR